MESSFVLELIAAGVATGSVKASSPFFCKSRMRGIPFRGAAAGPFRRICPILAGGPATVRAGGPPESTCCSRSEGAPAHVRASADAPLFRRLAKVAFARVDQLPSQIDTPPTDRFAV